MLKRIIGTMAVAVLIVAPAQQVSAQVAKGYTDIGVTVGVGNTGNAGLAFGLRFEHIFKELPDLGGGLLGIGISADYYGYSDGFVGYGYDVRYIPIGATANYHFKLENKKIDAFVGAGLGYQMITCNVTGVGFSNSYCSNSALYFIGRVGGRYFLKPNLALYADAGAGAATLNVGLTFKLK